VEGHEHRTWRDWAKEVATALERAEAMVVLMSRSYLESPYLKHELEYALGNIRFKDRLFPVLAKETTEVPWILKEIHWLDIHRDPREGSRSVVNAVKKQAARGATS